MSNFRRSWSLIGERAVLPQQQEYENEYLFSALDPINGESFHLILPTMTTDLMLLFLTELKKQHPTQPVVVVCDNAPCHRRKDLHTIDGLTLIHLPSYSPQLNPAERFFEEIRRATANRIFDSLTKQAERITGAINEWCDASARLRQLIGFGWIQEQFGGVG